jgi:competence protein ComGC
MNIAMIIVGGIVLISTVPVLLSHLGHIAKLKKDTEIEKIKYQKQIMELELEKEKTKLKLLEEENKNLDKIIYEKNT